jgi:(R,R)-butanediol dehydrogenase / meso-butanediol dehydrogenase / diacetyl reductase
MSETMKALVWTAPETVETRRLPVPTAGPGEAVVRVKAAGICGTDLSILHGKHPRARAPLVMGHELSGVVAELGPALPGGTPRLRVGDRVVCEPLISCGVCHACRSGFPWVCQKLGLYGIDRDGAFAEYMKVAASSLLPIPDAIDDRLAALVEPVAVAVHAVRLSSVRVGDDVCVLGGGPIGLLTAVVARRAGPARVILAERESFRIELARSFGFEVVDAGSTDIEKEVLARTGGRGADVVFEVAGAPETVLAAPRITRVKGEVVAVAMPKTPQPYDIVALTFKELTVKGVRVYAPFDFGRAVTVVEESLRDSRVDLRKLISEPFTLDQGAEAFRRAQEARGIMRVVFAC